MPGDRTIQEAMQVFLDSLNAAHTRQAYATPLKHFGTYLAGQGVHVDRASATALTVDHAIDFAPWLRHDWFSDPGPAKATLQLYLTAVYRFYRSLLKRGVAFEAADIARLEETYRDARNVRGERRPKDPKLGAVEAIIQAARSIPPVSGDKPAHRKRELTRLRDIAIVEMLRSTGCRVGELVALRRGDLDWMTHGALVKGKGTKYRKVYLDDQAWRALRTYLQTRHAERGGDARVPRSEGARALARLPVFCGHGNRSGRTPSPLTTRHVARTIRDLAEKAGIGEVGVTPHYFRHVFATRALERTENLALVQDMLGHASPATTRIYARTNEAQRREGYARVWDEMERSVAERPRTGEALVSRDGGTQAERGDSFEVAASILRAVRVGDDDAIEEGARLRLMRAAMTEMLCSTGCCLDELVALRLGDVDRAACRARFTSYSELRTYHFNDQTLAALHAYLAVRGELSTSLIFCEQDGSSLTPERVFSMIRDVAKEEGVDGERLFPGLFRGVFIHRALEATGDLDVVRGMVGDDLSALELITAHA